MNAGPPGVPAPTVVWWREDRGGRLVELLIVGPGPTTVADQIWPRVIATSATGAVAWSNPGIAGTPAGYSSVVDAGSVLLALTTASQLYVVQPNDKAFTQVTSIKVADTPSYAYPVISGNRIFIRDSDSVALLTVE